MTKLIAVASVIGVCLVAVAIWTEIHGEAPGPAEAATIAIFVVLALTLIAGMLWVGWRILRWLLEKKAVPAKEPARKATLSEPEREDSKASKVQEPKIEKG